MKPKPVKQRSLFFAEVLLRDSRLKPVDRMLLAFIASYDVCYASNGYMAKFAGCCSGTVSRSINQMKYYGYILKNEVFEKNGRRTYLRTVITALKYIPLHDKKKHKHPSKPSHRSSKAYMRVPLDLEDF